MSETFSDDPTLLQVCSNLKLAESLASQSGRDANSPHLNPEQEKAYLELLRDHLKSLQKTVQVGLLDRYIRICNKSSVGYSPLPITGLKACLYILKVSTESTDSSIQEKLAAVIETWREMLVPIVGSQIAGSRSIWTSKALCQLSGRPENVPTPSGTTKRKRSLDNIDGACNHDFSPSSFPPRQHDQTSSSKIQHEITHHSTPSTPVQQTNILPLVETSLNPTISQANNMLKSPTTQPPSNHVRNPLDDAVIKPAIASSGPSSSRPLVSLVSDHQIVSQDVESLPSSLSRRIFSRASQPIHQKVSLSTSNLLSYWQHTFQMLDLAVTELLEITPLLPHVPLSKDSCYYPQVYTPDFQWIPQAVPTYAPLAILKCANASPVLTSQSLQPLSNFALQPITITTPANSSHQSNPASSNINPDALAKLPECTNATPVLTPQSLQPPVNSTLQPITINTSPTSSSHQSNPALTNINPDTLANLPTPVSPKWHTLQTTVAVSQGQAIPHPIVIQNSGTSQQGLVQHPHPDVPDLKQCSQQLNTVQNPKQLPQQPSKALNCTPSVLMPQESPVKPNQFLSPIVPIQEPQIDLPAPSQTTQPSQQIQKTLPSQPLIQQPLNPMSQPILQITETQKIKFVETYQKVDARGKAKLEATLRKNHLWEHLSPLLYTPSTEVTNQSMSEKICHNSTLVQPLTSSSLAPSNPSVEVLTTTEESHASEIIPPPQSDAHPQATSSETQTPLDETSLNTSSISNTSLDPILSKMIIAMLAPEPQAHSVLIGAFETLGIHNSNAIITHLEALAECSNGVDDRFWKLRPQVEAAVPSILALVEPSMSTSENMQPAAISLDLSSEPQITKEIKQHKAADCALDVKADNTKQDHVSHVEPTKNTEELFKTPRPAEANVESDDSIEIISINKLNCSKNLIQSNSPTQTSVTSNNSKNKQFSTEKRPVKDLQSSLKFNLFQDDLPGFPDVDPSIQIQGTQARILARFPANQQMPPIRTFVPLSRKNKPTL